MNIGRHIRNNLVGYIALFIALSGTAWAAGQIGSADIADNAILTRHIKDGQVKNADLGKAVVTRPKLGPGAVGPGQIANGAVNNLKLAGSAVSSPKVADGSLTGADVSNNSLTGADIDESKLYAETRTVSPVGTPLQNGQALSDMLASITDAGLAKPYLVKLEPGGYDVGATALQMPAHVDLEGSGWNSTELDSSSAGGATLVLNNPGAPAVVREMKVVHTGTGQAISAQSNLTLENDLVESFGSGSQIGVLAAGGLQLTVHDTQVFATAGANFAYGIETDGNTTSLSIDGSFIKALKAGAGVFPSALNINGFSADVRGSSLIGTGSGPAGFGVIDNGNTSTVTIDASLVQGDQKAAGAGTGDSILIGASKVVGGHDAAAPGTVTCVFSYKATYVATNATCD